MLWRPGATGWRLRRWRDRGIDTIFRGRPAQYCSEPYEAEVSERAVSVLQANGPEVIVIYLS